MQKNEKKKGMIKKVTHGNLSAENTQYKNVFCKTIVRSSENIKGQKIK